MIVADHRVRLNLALDGEVALGGEISRIDMIPTGYRAVLLMARAPARWKQELRMPLIQLAVANRYDRPPGDVRVAVQLLDGNGLDEGAFPVGVRGRRVAFGNSDRSAGETHVGAAAANQDVT